MSGGGMGQQIGNLLQRGGGMRFGGGYQPQGMMGRAVPQNFQRPGTSVGDGSIGFAGADAMVGSTKPMQVQQPRAMDTNGLLTSQMGSTIPNTGGPAAGGPGNPAGVFLQGRQSIMPYSWGNFGARTQFNTLDDALGAVAQNHPELAGQRVNLMDQGRFPELFQNGNYIGPNPVSNFQQDATYSEDPLFAARMMRAGRNPNDIYSPLIQAGLPQNYTGQFNNGFYINGRPLNGAGQADFNNMFNLMLPGR